MKELGRVVTAVLVVTALALGAIGCTATDRASGQCVAAFRDATPRAESPNQVSPLDDAIKKCRSVEAWTDAWDRVPEAHPPGKEAIPYLRERCPAQELQVTALCREVEALGVVNHIGESQGKGGAWVLSQGSSRLKPVSHHEG